jgi:hypothetical protein
MFRLPLFSRLSQSQREQLNAGFIAYTFSQILHGEQGALLVASKLIQVTEHVGTP